MKVLILLILALDLHKKLECRQSFHKQNLQSLSIAFPSLSSVAKFTSQLDDALDQAEDLIDFSYPGNENSKTA